MLSFVILLYPIKVFSLLNYFAVSPATLRNVQYFNWDRSMQFWNSHSWKYCVHYVPEWANINIRYLYFIWEHHTEVFCQKLQRHLRYQKATRHPERNKGSQLYYWSKGRVSRDTHSENVHLGSNLSELWVAGEILHAAMKQVCSATQPEKLPSVLHTHTTSIKTEDWAIPF